MDHIERYVIYRSMPRTMCYTMIYMLPLRDNFLDAYDNITQYPQQLHTTCDGNEMIITNQLEKPLTSMELVLTTYEYEDIVAFNDLLQL